MAEAPPVRKTVHHFGINETASQEAAITLLVRHLPEAIPYDTLSRLFSHYGASSLRPCTYGRVRNCAFVGFKNEALASQVQKQLHWSQFLGKVLSVERARELIVERKHQERELLTRMDFVLTNKATFVTVFSDSSRRDSTHTREPISQKFGVEYPFPPHLEYVSLAARFALDEQNEYSSSISYYTAHSTSTSSKPVPPPPPPSPPPPLATKTDAED